MAISQSTPAAPSAPVMKGGVVDAYSAASHRTTEEYRARLARQIPLRRFGSPDEVATVIEFLLSRQASFITGEAVNVTGGQEVH